MKNFIVMTTIRRMTPALEAFCRLNDWQVVVVADRKTPPFPSSQRCTVLSIEGQRGLPFHSLAHTPFNHYSRKNLGYLYALSHGADVIYDVDDDNLPHPNWGMPAWKSDRQLAQENGFINVYRHFTADLIWPRGFPLDQVRNSFAHRPVVQPMTEAANVGAWCGVVDGDADVDAIYRLVVGQAVTFDAQAEPVTLRKGAWCPFNSQNTFWANSSAAALYLPISVTFRFTDILRGYVAQRLFWESNSVLGFLPPIAYQERNPHDLMVDFSDEYPVYLQTREVVRALEAIRLDPGDNTANLIRIYERLESLQIVQASDVAAVKAWAADVEQCCGSGGIPLKSLQSV